MKRVLILLSLLFCNMVFADTINLHWLNEDGTIYESTICTVGNDLEIPTPSPSKRGYTFAGWDLLPFTQLEYIESTGTQWINTGVEPDIYTHVYVKAKYVKCIHNEFDTIVGSTAGYSQSRFYPFGSTNDCRNLRQTFGTSQYEQPFDTNVHTVDFNSTNNEIFVDGNFVATINTNSYINNNKPLYLFVTNNAGGTSWAGAVRIYEYKVYKNNVLIQNLIPVLDHNGIPCMYDIVTQQFFYNQGTGQFIAGPVLQ